MTLTPTPKKCPHPPSRYFCWIVKEIANDPDSKDILCIGCCDCGESWAGTLRTRKGKGKSK